MSSSSTPISNSGDEDNAEQAVYSSFAAHEVIVIINGGSMGLLQVTAQSTNAADHRATLLSFYFFIILIYAVLRVSEVTLRRNQAPFHHFVGYISHLFGVLAALMLISIVSPIFTLIVAPLWLVWFFVVMYFFLAKLIRGEINHPRNEVNSDQISQA